jgi:hypothetical protein
MRLQDYAVQRDHFEPDESPQFCFPCYACIHVSGAGDKEPCRSCDHNAAAARENDPAVVGRALAEAIGQIMHKPMGEDDDQAT